MGKKNRERRAAKAKKRIKGRARQGPGPHSDAAWAAGDGWLRPPGDADRVRMLLEAVVTARLRGDIAAASEMIQALTRHDEQVVVREVGAELRRVLPVLWDAGWQPAEIAGQARRSSARVGRLVAAAVLADHAPRPATTLHARWAAQVADLAAADRPAHVAASARDWLDAFARREALRGDALVGALLDALTTCLGVGPLPVIVPPPGRSATQTDATGRASANVADDDPVLAKVRALLTQAESTSFEAEAAAFTAKAHELMARHAIDVAFIWERAGRDERPVTIRLPIDDPYVDVKSLLLQFVAVHSRCRAVFHDRYALSSVIGFASDVAATEMLFTSLLVQSQMAMQAEAAVGGPGSRVRSRSFRSSFLLAYAHRIEERLNKVNCSVESEADVTHDGSLLPVLAARSDAVDETIDELFGELRAAPVRGGTDGFGWTRGRMAADLAQLTFGDLDGAPEHFSGGAGAGTGTSAVPIGAI